MKNEKTSKKVQHIAAKGIKNPESLTPEEVKAVCASALTQSADTTTSKSRKKKSKSNRSPVEQYFDLLLIGQYKEADEMVFNQIELDQIGGIGRHALRFAEPEEREAYSTENVY